VAGLELRSVFLKLWNSLVKEEQEGAGSASSVFRPKERREGEGGGRRQINEGRDRFCKKFGETASREKREEKRWRGGNSRNIVSSGS